MQFFTLEQFTGTLKMALLIARVQPTRADNIIQAATGVIDLTVVTRANAMILITSIVRQATVPDPAPAPGPIAALQRFTEPQVRLILGPVVRVAIAECAPVFCQATHVAMWGPHIVTLITEPRRLIHSVRTAERITAIGTELRKKAPLTCAAICAGPIPRPADNAIAAAITFVLSSYFSRLVRQYLYKVTEEALQANRAFSSTVPAALLNKILVDLGEPNYITSDIPVSSAKRPR